jgi:hypothetical protein
VEVEVMATAAAKKVTKSQSEEKNYEKKFKE